MNDIELRKRWARGAAKRHAWPSTSTPPMTRDGRFETDWHESEYQVWLEGYRAASKEAPPGYALVPVEHNVSDPLHRWDHMCLAASKALRDPGFNSNEMIAAAKDGNWNSSNLIRHIVAAAVKRSSMQQIES